jgi:hypothetical protein
VILLAKHILIGLASINSLLVFDSARFHKIEAIREAARRPNTVIAVIPGGLAYVIQPLDVSFNRPFRQLVEELQDKLLNQETGEEDDDDTTDEDIEDITDWSLPKRRVFMTRVISQAYFHLHVCPRLVRSFMCTGINIEPDGSQDNLISIKGFINEQDLDISGWRTIPTMKIEESAVNEPESEPHTHAREPVAEIDLTQA